MLTRNFVYALLWSLSLTTLAQKLQMFRAVFVKVCIDRIQKVALSKSAAG